MPESVTPLIAVGVVIVLFIVLLSVLTSNYSLNGIKCGSGVLHNLSARPV